VVQQKSDPLLYASIKLDGELDDFDTELQQCVLSDLSSLLSVSLEDIKVVSIEQGSVILTVLITAAPGNGSLGEKDISCAVEGQSLGGLLLWLLRVGLVSM